MVWSMPLNKGGRHWIFKQSGLAECKMQDVGCRQASILGDQPETGAFLVFGRKKGLRGRSQGGRLQVLITLRYVNFPKTCRICSTASSTTLSRSTPSFRRMGMYL